MPDALLWLSKCSAEHAQNRRPRPSAIFNAARVRSLPAPVKVAFHLLFDIDSWWVKEGAGRLLPGSSSLCWRIVVGRPYSRGRRAFFPEGNRLPSGGLLSAARAAQSIVGAPSGTEAGREGRAELIAKASGVLVAKNVGSREHRGWADRSIWCCQLKPRYGSSRGSVVVIR